VLAWKPPEITTQRNAKVTVLVVMAAVIAAIVVFYLVSRDVTPEEFSNPASRRAATAKP
jgi:hypothetical protein